MVSVLRQMCIRDSFVTDYELMIFAEVLGVTMDWLTGKE